MKINKITVFILILFLVLIIALIDSITIKKMISSKPENTTSRPLAKIQLGNSIIQAGSVPFRVGERFLYQVKFGVLRVGSAELIFQGRGILDGRDAYIITFEVKLSNFYDKETIYVELDSFYPLKVERIIKMFGRDIEITEDYNQKEKFVKIQRKEAAKTATQVIQSDKKIQNIISLVYLYRNIEFKDGSILTFNLPLKKIDMKLSNIEEIEVPKGEYKAYLLESMPKKYKFWLDTNKERTPLRIDGAVSFSGAKMVLEQVN